MKTIGVIPARWGSTRFPGKSLALIAGKPLIQRVLERVLQARSLDRVVVAVDDERIAACCRGQGCDVVMTREDHPSGTDRVAEAVAGMDGDVVINIQGDEPLIAPELIDGLSGVFEQPQWDMATAASPLKWQRDLESPAVVKVVLDQQDGALYFSRAPIPHARDGAPPLTEVPGVYWRHVGIYAYRLDYLRKLVSAPPDPLEELEKLEQLRALRMGCRMKVLRVDEAAPGVDLPEDVPRVEALLARGAQH